MLHRKNITLVALTMLMAVSSVLAGCAPSPTPTPQVIKEKETVVVPPTPVPTPVEVVEIKWWTHVLKDAFAEYLQGLIDAYQAAHPNVKIVWADLGAEQREKFMSDVAAGTAPDLADWHRAYGFATLAGLGLLENLDELVPDEAKKAYSETLWKEGSGTYQGVTYGIPWYGGSFLLYYNKDLFKKAGLDPEKPPTTYKELLDYARQIKEKMGVYGLSFFSNAYYLQEIFFLDGVPLVSVDGKTAVINTPRAIEVLDMWAKAYKDGVLPPEAIAVGAQAGYVRDDVDWFNSETTAMLLSAPWLTRTLPDSLLPKLGMANGPLGETGRYNFAGHFWVVPKQSKHKKEALDFALFITSPENQLAFCKLVAITPSTVKTLADPLFSTKPAQLVTKDDFDQMGRYLVAGQLLNAASPPITPGWDEMMEVLRVEVNHVFLGEKTSAKALADVEAAWNKILAREF